MLVGIFQCGDLVSASKSVGVIEDVISKSPGADIYVFPELFISGYVVGTSTLNSKKKNLVMAGIRT